MQMASSTSRKLQACAFGLAKKTETRRKTKRLKAKIRQLDAAYQTAGGFNDRNHADVSMMLIMMMATLGEKSFRGRNSA